MRLFRYFYLYAGFFAQMSTLAFNFLLINGNKLDNEIRASWIKGGMIGLIALGITGCLGLLFLNR